jgi:3',5'-cyclic-AMP phosphodiesterase
MKRSTFLQNATALIGGSMLSPSGLAQKGSAGKIRFAYLTDIHVKPDPTAEKGMAKALHHAQSIKPSVDFIINGGDSIMDALEVDKQQVKTQWGLFHSILEKENSLPIYHCIGNHDVWGWFIKNDKPDADKLYGKQWAVETLNLPARYYSFEKNKWKFIVLDSTQLNPEGGYIAYIDSEQLNWLQKELDQSKGKFICIISHIPILSICAGLFFNKTETNGDLKIQRNLMHTDFFSLKKIFLTHPNIKVCLSGHIHLQDEMQYLGIKYYCNGAVSGNWWKGAFQEFAPAYAIIELSDDGSSTRKMVNYGD